AAGFIELNVDCLVAILQMRKIGSRVATFVGADGNRMIERFEHVVSVGGKWLFNQLDSKFFQRRDRVSIVMSDHDSLASMSRRGFGAAARTASIRARSLSSPQSFNLRIGKSIAAT